MSPETLTRKLANHNSSSEATMRAGVWVVAAKPPRWVAAEGSRATPFIYYPTRTEDPPSSHERFMRLAERARRRAEASSDYPDDSDTLDERAELIEGLVRGQGGAITEDR